MKARISTILIIFVLSSSTVFASFKQVDPNAFESFHSIRQFFRLVESCTWHISCYFAPHLGSFTTISSTDVISNFPTTYNNNLIKTIEVGTTSIASLTDLPNLATANSLTSASALATVGTIASGVWHGTAVDPPYGGTGSTTLSLNQVLLGNGTTQLNVVKGLGTSGQFLTSQGLGNPPQWTTAAVDQSITYTWTGSHFFSSKETNLMASTSILANSTTTAALVLNGVPYSFPRVTNGTTTATSSIWVFDGNSNGTLQPKYETMSTFMPLPITGTYATSSQLTNGNTVTICGLFTLPHQMTIANISFYSNNSPGVNGTIKIGIYSDGGNGGTGDKLIDVTSGTISSSNTVYTASVSPTVTLPPGNFYECILPIGTLNATLAYYYNGNNSPLVTVSSQPVTQGTKSVSADTLPSTIDFTTLGGNPNSLGMLVTRFDD